MGLGNYLITGIITLSIIGITPVSPFRELISRVLSPVIRLLSPMGLPVVPKPKLLGALALRVSHRGKKGTVYLEPYTAYVAFQKSLELRVSGYTALGRDIWGFWV